MNEASSLITEEADEEAEIIFGSVIDENLKDEVRVTVIATGFNPVVQTELSEAPAKKSETQPVAQPQAQPEQAMPISTASPNMVTPPLERKEPLSTDLKTARQLAREIGKRFFDTEEYDIPTFLRRQQD